MEKLQENREAIAKKKREACSTGVDDLMTMLKAVCTDKNAIQNACSKRGQLILPSAYHDD